VVWHCCWNIVDMVPDLLYVWHKRVEAVRMVEACRSVTANTRHMCVKFGFFRKLTIPLFVEKQPHLVVIMEFLCMSLIQ